MCVCMLCVDSSIDIGENMTVPDRFKSSQQMTITFLAGGISGFCSRTLTAPVLTLTHTYLYVYL